MPRVEVLPADELPVGTQAVPLAESTSERDADGKFQPGACTAQSAGGRALREQTRLARRLALGSTFSDPRFEPYANAARAFRRTHVTRLAREVGGGECGPAPASIVATAALQLAGSRFAFEVLGDLALGSRLGNDSRQNLLAAHELCAREAKARPAAPDAFPWLSAANGPSRHAVATSPAAATSYDPTSKKCQGGAEAPETGSAEEVEKGVTELVTPGGRHG